MPFASAATVTTSVSMDKYGTATNLPPPDWRLIEGFNLTYWTVVNCFEYAVAEFDLTGINGQIESATLVGLKRTPVTGGGTLSEVRIGYTQDCTGELETDFSMSIPITNWVSLTPAEIAQLSGSGVSVELPGLDLSKNNLFIRIQCLSVNGPTQGALSTTLALDITTTQVPEPSTYAAIAGALALGAVAYRRRNRH